METTIPSYLCAKPSRDLLVAARQETTRELWPKLPTHFECYISALVYQDFGGALMKDPIVEEVRKHRMEHTKKFGANLTAIYKDLKRIERSCGHKIVRLPARKLKTTRRISAVR